MAENATAATMTEVPNDSLAEAQKEETILLAHIDDLLSRIADSQAEVESLKAKNAALREVTKSKLAELDALFYGSSKVA